MNGPSPSTLSSQPYLRISYFGHRARAWRPRSRSRIESHCILFAIIQHYHYYTPYRRFAQPRTNFTPPFPPLAHHGKSKPHTAAPSNPPHDPSPISRSILPLLDLPVAVLAGATTVVPAVPVADAPALVVIMVDVDVKEEEVARGMMVLLVV